MTSALHAAALALPTGHPVDAATSLAIIESESMREMWRIGGGIACAFAVLTVLGVLVYPSAARAYARLKRAVSANPLRAAALAVFLIPLIHYGATKYVPPVREVATTVTSEGVSFSWEMDGHRPTTQYAIFRTFEAEPGVTNTVQHAIVTGETSYTDAFPGADACDWSIRYLPPVIVQGDEIQITSFESPTTGGLRMSWRVKDKVVAGVDVFDVKMRHRAIPSRTGWTAWETVQSGTATNYADTAFHHFQDEEWRIECTKEDDE